MGEFTSLNLSEIKTLHIKQSRPDNVSTNHNAVHLPMLICTVIGLLKVVISIKPKWSYDKTPERKPDGLGKICVNPRFLKPHGPYLCLQPYFLFCGNASWQQLITSKDLLE